MKRFEIILGSWTGNREYTLQHESKTENEFKTDVKWLMKHHGNDYLNSEFEHGWAECSDWVQFIIPKMLELGYTEPDPNDIVHFYMNDIGIISEQKTDYNDEFIEIVGEDLFKSACEKNKALNDER